MTISRSNNHQQLTKLFGFSIVLVLRLYLTESFIAGVTTTFLTFDKKRYKSPETRVKMRSEKKNSKQPSKAPLPPPILSETVGTWSYDTMSRRVNNEIMERTYQENINFFKEHPFALENFNKLRNELEHAATTPLRHLLKQNVRDEEDWFDILQPFVSQNKTWLSAPWLVAEFYLYRRILEAIGYFDESNPSTFQKDLFETQKYASIESSPDTTEEILQRLSPLLSGAGAFTFETFSIFVNLALWGNQMDLSIWPTGSDSSSERENALWKVVESSTENLLWDDSKLIHEYSNPTKGCSLDSNIDVVVDNAGLELVTDLILADYLISSGMTSKVTFRVKSLPTFVSDALEKDLVYTVETYANLDNETYTFCQAAGCRWKTYLANQLWVCSPDDYWVQPKPMWDMPSDLYQEMSKSTLAFIKGDANYRRLLGDLQWDLTNDSFQNVVGDYFPSHVVALRTLKAMLGCGMDKEKVNRAKANDANWMVNGKFGVIQFGVPPSTQEEK